MKINAKIIKNLKPCIDRHHNYLKHYDQKSFTVSQFVNLKNITYFDKCWVLLRLLTVDNLIVFSIDCSFRADADAAYAAANAAVDAYAAAYAAANAADVCAAADDAYTAYVYAVDVCAAAAYDAARSKNETLEVLIYLISNQNNTIKVLECSDKYGGV